MSFCVENNYPELYIHIVASSDLKGTSKTKTYDIRVMVMFYNGIV